MSAVPGRGIIATFQLLEKFGASRGDVIVYDVLGDVVCGGFAMPMREGYAQSLSGHLRGARCPCMRPTTSARRSSGLRLG